MNGKAADRAAEILKPLIKINIPYRQLKLSSPSRFKDLDAKLPELGLREKVESWCSQNNESFDEVWVTSSSRVYYLGKFLIHQLRGGQIKEEKKEPQKEFGEEQQDLIPDYSEYEKYQPRIIYGQKDIDILKKAFDAGTPVLIEGVAGIGKNAMVRAFCAYYEVPYFRVNLNGGTTVEDLVGAWIPCNGGFVWADGVLTRMMRHGGVLVVDEINAATPDVLFILHSILDDERVLVLVQKDGEVVKAHPKFLLVATCHPIDYAGVREMNEALKDRFLLQLKLSADEKVERALIKDKRILEMVRLLRKAYMKGQLTEMVSTRQLLALQRNIGVFGADLALKSFTNRFDLAEGGAVKIIAEILELIKQTDDVALAEKVKDLENKL